MSHLVHGQETALEWIRVGTHRMMFFVQACESSMPGECQHPGSAPAFQVDHENQAAVPALDFFPQTIILPCRKAYRGNVIHSWLENLPCLDGPSSERRAHEDFRPWVYASTKRKAEDLDIEIDNKGCTKPQFFQRSCQRTEAQVMPVNQNLSCQQAHLVSYTTLL